MGSRWTEEDYASYVAGRVKRETAPTDPTQSIELEASFQARILRLATDHGWLCYHTHDSRHNDWRSADGFPDLVLVREAVIFAELKTRTGKASAAQERWLAMLRHTGQVEVYLWRPGQWAQITERLTRAWEQVSAAQNG